MALTMKSATAAFGGFVQLEIVPQWFVDDLSAGATNGSGGIGDDWVDYGMCRRDKHLEVSRFAGSVGR